MKQQEEIKRKKQLEEEEMKKREYEKEQKMLQERLALEKLQKQKKEEEELILRIQNEEIRRKKAKEEEEKQQKLDQEEWFRKQKQDEEQRILDEIALREREIPLDKAAQIEQKRSQLRQQVQQNLSMDMKQLNELTQISNSKEDFFFPQQQLKKSLTDFSQGKLFPPSSESIASEPFLLNQNALVSKDPELEQEPKIKDSLKGKVDSMWTTQMIVDDEESPGTKSKNVINETITGQKRNLVKPIVPLTQSEVIAQYDYPKLPSSIKQPQNIANVAGANKLQSQQMPNFQQLDQTQGVLQKNMGPFGFESMDMNPIEEQMNKISQMQGKGGSSFDQNSFNYEALMNGPGEGASKIFSEQKPLRDIQFREQIEQAKHFHFCFDKISFVLLPDGDQATTRMLKPRVNVKIFSGSPYQTFQIELNGRINSMEKGNQVKEFELIGSNKRTTIAGVKISQIQCWYRMVIQVLDEFSNSQIAKQEITMERLFCVENFKHLILDIQPTQLFHKHFKVLLSMQTYVQQIIIQQQVLPVQQQIPIDQGNQKKRNSRQITFNSNLDSKQQLAATRRGEKIVNRVGGKGDGSVPIDFQGHLNAVLEYQNHFVDSYYASRICLERFSPEAFKIVFDFIAFKQIKSISELTTQKCKRSSKNDSYKDIQHALFRHYMVHQALHQSRIVAYLASWNLLYEDVILAADAMNEAIEAGEQLESAQLVASDIMIMKEGIELIHRGVDRGEQNSNQNDRLVKTYGLMRNKMMNIKNKNESKSLAGRSCSIYYLHDTWGTSLKKEYQILYNRLNGLVVVGVPNELRQTLWFELAKVEKYVYSLDFLLYRENLIDQREYFAFATAANAANSFAGDDFAGASVKMLSPKQLKSSVYLRFLAFAGRNELGESQWREQQCFAEVAKDIQYYQDREIAKNQCSGVCLSEQDVIDLTRIFSAFVVYVQMHGEVVYAKVLIPFAVRALEYFRSVSSYAAVAAVYSVGEVESSGDSESEQSIENDVEVSVFWLLVSVVNVFAKRYYNISQSAISDAAANVGMNGSRISYRVAAMSNGTGNENSLGLQWNLLFDGAIADQQVFMHLLESKAADVSKFFKDIGFAIDVFFLEHALSFFADLLSHEVLFRVWDIAFFEAAAESAAATTATTTERGTATGKEKKGIQIPQKIAYFLMSVMIAFLQVNSAIILRTNGSIEHIRLVLALAGKFDIEDCDAFIVRCLEIYYSITSRDSSSSSGRSSSSSVKEEKLGVEDFIVAQQQSQLKQNGQKSESKNNRVDLQKLVSYQLAVASRLTKSQMKTLNFKEDSVQSSEALKRKYAEVIENAYTEDMVKTTSQLALMNSLNFGSGNISSAIWNNHSNSTQHSHQSQLDLEAIGLTLDAVEAYLKQSTQQQQQQQELQQQSQQSKQMKSKVPPLVLKDLSQIVESKIFTVSNQQQQQLKSGMGLVINSKFNKSNNFGGNPSQIYLKIHSIEWNDLSNKNLIVKIFYGKECKCIVMNSISDAEITEQFESRLDDMSQLEGEDSYSKDQIRIELYETINQVVIPRKYSNIYLSEYPRETLSLDSQVIHEIGFDGNYAGNFDNDQGNEGRSKINSNSRRISAVASAATDQVLMSQIEAKRSHVIEGIQKSRNEKTKSFVHFSILISSVDLTEQLSDSQDQTFPTEGIKQFQKSMSTKSLIANSTSEVLSSRIPLQRPETVADQRQNRTTHGVPQHSNALIPGGGTQNGFGRKSEVGSARSTNKGIQSVNQNSFNRFNELITKQEFGQISHGSMVDSMMSCVRAALLMTQEQFRVLLLSSKAEVWQNALKQQSSASLSNPWLNQLGNLFKYEGKIPVFEVLLTAIILAEGREHQKSQYYSRIAGLVSLNPSNAVKFSNLANKPKEIKRIVLLEILWQIHLKNSLIVSKQFVLESLISTLNREGDRDQPGIYEAKYYFDSNYPDFMCAKHAEAVAEERLSKDIKIGDASFGGRESRQGNQQKQEISRQSRKQNEQFNTDKSLMVSKIENAINITRFIKGFCAQQLQQTGVMDVALSSTEFATSLFSLLSSIEINTNKSGTILIHYQSKGQFRSFRGSYAHTLGDSETFKYVRTEKQQLGSAFSTKRRVNDGEDRDQQAEFKIEEEEQRLPQNNTNRLGELLDFNDSVIQLRFGEKLISNSDVLSSIERLPLFNYFNSLQNSLYSSQRARDRKRNRGRVELKKHHPFPFQTIFLNIELDGVSQGYFKIVESLMNDKFSQVSSLDQKKLNSQLQQSLFSLGGQQVQPVNYSSSRVAESLKQYNRKKSEYSNVPAAIVLEDWKELKELKKDWRSQFNYGSAYGQGGPQGITSAISNSGTAGFAQDDSDVSKIILMEVDFVPLNLRIRELSRFIAVRLMENCIKHVGEAKLINGSEPDRSWLRFLSSIQHIDLLSNLQSIRYLDPNTKQFLLDFELTLQQNLSNHRMVVQDLEKICLVFDYRTEIQQHASIYKSLSESTQTRHLQQQYALFKFKGEAKRWMPCKILGCDVDSGNSETRFYVEFNAFPKCVYVKSQKEIASDSDMTLDNLLINQEDIVEKEESNDRFNSSIQQLNYSKIVDSERSYIINNAIPQLGANQQNSTIIANNLMRAQTKSQNIMNSSRMQNNNQNNGQISQILNNHAQQQLQDQDIEESIDQQTPKNQEFDKLDQQQQNNLLAQEIKKKSILQQSQLMQLPFNRNPLNLSFFQN